MDAAAQLELILRLAIGLVLGAIIGVEREFNRQPAGFRTHSLVALGATMFTVVSAYAFPGQGGDPTRIAAQIVTGIGFIGAGTILRHEANVRGLTTAASLWSVAAIGMASGAGLYAVAIGGTILVFIVLAIFNWLEGGLKRLLKIPVDAEPSEGRVEDM